MTVFYVRSLLLGALFIALFTCAGSVEAKFLGGSVRENNELFIDDALAYGVDDYYFSCLKQLQEGEDTNTDECKKSIHKFNIVSKNLEYGVIESGDRDLLLDLLLKLKDRVRNE